MKKICVAMLAVGLLIGLGSGLCSAQTTTAKKVEPGPKVGSKVKDFVVKDSKGKERKLSKLLKKGPVAIVFFRSADW
jgi:cytochrome oxidase Cu insertion factor (SCO1/SenC/PrrC family)